MSSSTLSSFWKEQASETLPGNASTQKRRISSAVSDSTSGGSCNVGVVAKEHLLQRVAAETEPQRLERDDLVRRDVPEVHGSAERLDEPRLRGLRRRLEHDVRGADDIGDLLDQVGAHASAAVEDAGGAALARLGDHLPRAGGELVVQPGRPLVDRVLDRRVLRPDLGQHGEVACEVCDQLELALARDLDRAVRDLDVRQTEVVQPVLVLVELAARVDNLEERP